MITYGKELEASVQKKLEFQPAFGTSSVEGEPTCPEQPDSTFFKPWTLIHNSSTCAYTQAKIPAKCGQITFIYLMFSLHECHVHVSEHKRSVEGIVDLNHKLFLFGKKEHLTAGYIKVEQME